MEDWVEDDGVNPTCKIHSLFNGMTEQYPGKEQEEMEGVTSLWTSLY